MICKNCSEPFDSEFCPHCGQTAQTNRIDSRYLLRSLLDWLDIDRGFFRATKLLLLKPGVSIRQYVEGKRADFYAPFKLFIIFAALGTYLQFRLGFYGTDTGEVDMMQKIHLSQAKEFSYYSTKYSTWFSFLAIPIFAILSWRSFLKSGFNYPENLIMNVYVAAGQFLLFCLFVPAIYFSTALFGTVYFVVNIVYNVWVLMVFFQATGFQGAAKAILVVIASYVLMFVVNYGIFTITPSGFWTTLDGLVD